MALADVPLKQFLNEAIVPYEDEEGARLISTAFDAISSLGGLRDWLLSDAATSAVLKRDSRGITPEWRPRCPIRNQDLDRLNQIHAAADQSVTQPSGRPRVKAGRHNLEEILAHPSMTCLNLRKALAEEV